jgi:hypothetical protein
MTRPVVLVGFLIIVLGLVSWIVWSAWDALGEVTISAEGYVALVAGVLATLGLGVGLMALVFFSSRRGYDAAADRAGRTGRDNGKDG